VNAENSHLYGSQSSAHERGRCIRQMVRKDTSIFFHVPYEYPLLSQTNRSIDWNAERNWQKSAHSPSYRPLERHNSDEQEHKEKQHSSMTESIGFMSCMRMIRDETREQDRSTQHSIEIGFQMCESPVFGWTSAGISHLRMLKVEEIAQSVPMR
jgi:hypothetical protein